MEFVEGRIFLDQNLPELNPAERRKVYAEMMKVLSQLHRFNPFTIGLEGYAKVGKNYFDRQINTWSK